MRCFSCITTRKRFPYENERLFDHFSSSSSDSPDGSRNSCSESYEPVRHALCLEDKQKVIDKIISNSARCFSYRELAVATKNFRESRVIGEGGFGKVYKGRLEHGEVVAIKRLNLESLQGNQEFIVEVLMLSLVHHPNLVTLIGYCAEGDQRLLVYEFMSRGSLADHLFDVEHEKDVLDWNTRLRIAAGAARGLEYLHFVAKPPVIYRDMKSANVLLDEDYSPKLSDFGLAKLGPIGDRTHVSTRVMGTYGYCAPEYAATGKLTQKSDIYCFGVMLLEIITGNKALDTTKRSSSEQSLVIRCRNSLKDKKKYMGLMDPRLSRRFPARSARHLIHVTALCLNEEAALRPSASEIVGALDYLVAESAQSSSSSSTTAPNTPTPTSLFSHQGNVFSPTLTNT